MQFELYNTNTIFYNKSDESSKVYFEEPLKSFKHFHSPSTFTHIKNHIVNQEQELNRSYITRFNVCSHFLLQIHASQIQTLVILISTCILCVTNILKSIK